MAPKHSIARATRAFSEERNPLPQIDPRVVGADVDVEMIAMTASVVRGDHCRETMCLGEVAGDVQQCLGAPIRWRRCRTGLVLGSLDEVLEDVELAPVGLEAHDVEPEANAVEAGLRLEPEG